MTPGIPGAGIGGLFYLASSLVLTLRHGWRRLRRQTWLNESRDVLPLAMLAAGIAIGVWVAGWLVGLVISPELIQGSRAGAVPFVRGARLHNVVRVAALLAGIVTLVAVMLGVELARITQRLRATSAETGR